MRQFFLRLQNFSLLSLLVVAPAAWASSDAGTDSALYLGLGARAVALGRAGATESGSVSAADWNPAGLADVGRIGATVQHAALFGNTVHDTLGMAYPLLDWGTAALTLTRLQTGSIDGRDADNLPSGNFDFIEQEMALAYGHELWGPLAFGGSLKLHDLRLDGLESTSPGLDLGLLLRLPHAPAKEAEKEPSAFQEFRAGASVRNAIGPMLRLRDEAERLHPTYRLGAAVDLCLFTAFPNLLSLRSDLEKPERSDWRFHEGAEYTLYGNFALRAGWDQEYFSAGAGVNYSGFTLDYAVSFPAVGLRHLMTLSTAWGDDLHDIQAIRQREQENQKQQVADRLKSEIIADYGKQAKALSAAGNYREAVKLWEKVLDWDPENRETQECVKTAQAELQRQEIAAHMDAANKYLQEERYVDVMLECKQTLELDPKYAAASRLYELAEKKATSLGELAFAKEVKAMTRVREHYVVGLKAYAQQNWEDAIRNWEEVLVDSPLQKQVYLYLDKAKAQLEKTRRSPVQAAAPQVAPAEQKRRELYKEAVNLSRTGKLKDATMTWEKILQENPKDEDAKNNLDKTRKDLINSEKRGIQW